MLVGPFDCTGHRTHIVSPHFYPSLLFSVHNDVSYPLSYCESTLLSISYRPPTMMFPIPSPVVSPHYYPSLIVRLQSSLFLARSYCQLNHEDSYCPLMLL